MRRRIWTRRAQPAPAYPAPRVLLHELRIVRETVIACGVAMVDVDDVVSTCVVAAWEAIQGGQFKVHEGTDPAHAMRRWLDGIAWRQAMHERRRAHHHREVLSADPLALAPAPPVLDLEDQIVARAGLRAWRALPARKRVVLLAVALGETAITLAGPLGVSERAVNKQIRRGRAQLQRATMADGEEESRVP